MAEAVLADASPGELQAGRGVVAAQVEVPAFAHDGDAHFRVAHTRAATGEWSPAQLELEPIVLHLTLRERSPCDSVQRLSAP